MKHIMFLFFMSVTVFAYTQSYSYLDTLNYTSPDYGKHGTWIENRNDTVCIWLYNKDTLVSFFKRPANQNDTINYIDSLEHKQGRWVRYYSGEFLVVYRAVYNYVNDTLHGVAQTYYLNDQLASECNYNKGICENYNIYYYEDGYIKRYTYLTNNNWHFSLLFADRGRLSIIQVFAIDDTWSYDGCVVYPEMNIGFDYKNVVRRYYRNGNYKWYISKEKGRHWAAKFDRQGKLIRFKAYDKQGKLLYDVYPKY